MNLHKLKILQSSLSTIWENGKPPNNKKNWGPHYCFPESPRPVSIGKIESYFMYNLAKTVCPQNALEIGTGFGYSSWWISCGMMNNGKLISIDNFSEGTEISKRKKFIQSSKEYLALANVTYLTASSPQDLPFILKDIKLDLAFIDGEHYANAPLTDFQELSKYLTPESVIIMHDVQEKYDVNKAIDFASDKGWNVHLLESSCGIAVIFKNYNIDKILSAFRKANNLELID